MNKVLLSLLLYVVAAQGAYLTPYFGDPSYINAGGDLKYGGFEWNCVTHPECVGSEGSALLGTVDESWDTVGWIGVLVQANSTVGHFTLFLHVQGGITMTCINGDCPGPPPFPISVSAFGSANLNLLVDVPYAGVLSFDRYLDGQFVGRELRSVAGGGQVLAVVQDSASRSEFLNEIGAINIDEQRTVELRNVQLTPEPSSLWLVGAALAALSTTRFRRRRHWHSNDACT